MEQVFKASQKNASVRGETQLVTLGSDDFVFKFLPCHEMLDHVECSQSLGVRMDWGSLAALFVCCGQQENKSYGVHPM